MAEKLVADKHETKALISEVREFTRPDPLKIPKPNPRIHYRWARNTPERLYEIEAEGYRVATSDEVTACGLKPRGDGAAHSGDLILCVEDWSWHKEKQEKKALLTRKQEEMMKRGINKQVSARVPGKDWKFNETIREE